MRRTGFTFRENGFRPAPLLQQLQEQRRHPACGRPVALQTADRWPIRGDGASPAGTSGLRMLLRDELDGVDALFIQPYRATGTAADGTVQTEDFFRWPSRSATGRHPGHHIEIEDSDPASSPSRTRARASSGRPSVAHPGPAHHVLPAPPSDLGPVAQAGRGADRRPRRPLRGLRA